ncbi:hypothetical protein BOX15_Mlig032776g1 [Macrostomum lignano]|uniref:Sodium/calcium exchanger membrane region domain-containing protein n=1 Tax=Macrostomum lignano TaxID=282301 RepID=A0A267GQ98_9PLAT|nr:hypothetical protein BOX15_Mlig032776g1 [Macrostomum lignano]
MRSWCRHFISDFIGHHRSVSMGYLTELIPTNLELDAASPGSSLLGASESLLSSRRLLATTVNTSIYYNYNCEIVNASHKGHIAWETCDFEKSTNALGGWIVLYVFVTIITFIAMAIVCDDFFVPSLEVISEKLNLSEDVAGATFMAAGSSAPELFSSLAAVSFDSDAGVGTIAGSAVFNLLVIVSMSAAFAGQVLHLDWRPLARDSVWYLISILFFIFVMYDSIVQIWDAVILLVLYALYIVIMVLNSRLMDRLAEAEKKCACSKVEPGDVEGSGSSSTGADASAVTQSTTSIGEHREVKHFKHDRRNSVLLALHDSKLSVREGDKESSGAAVAKSNGEASKSKSGNDEVTAKQTSTSGANQEEGKDAEDSNAEEDEGGRIACCACCSCCPDLRGAPPERPVAEDGGRPTCCQGTVYVLKWIVFVLAFPFICLFSWTIPECSKEHLKKYFILSFIMSIVWIAAVSFCMVTVVARLGCLFGIDAFVMSLVVLAAGTSIPDLLSSIIVAKDGSGDMAVSNAIGSNVFDINLGLGLPFFIKLCINRMEPIDMFSDKERQYYCQGAMRMIPHVKFGIILIILLVMCFSVIAIARFKLGKAIGISFFLFYIGFLVYAFLQEFLCTYDC